MSICVIYWSIDLYTEPSTRLLLAVNETVMRFTSVKNANFYVEVIIRAREDMDNSFVSGTSSHCRKMFSIPSQIPHSTFIPLQLCTMTSK